MARPSVSQAGGLGEKSVGLSLHFLQEEIELLADFAGARHQAAELVDVAEQARELFANVGALGEQRRFLSQAAWFDGSAA